MCHVIIIVADAVVSVVGVYLNVFKHKPEEVKFVWRTVALKAKYFLKYFLGKLDYRKSITFEYNP